MRLTASAMLLAFACAAPALAQTEAKEAKPQTETEKYWRIECSGIGG